MRRIEASLRAMSPALLLIVLLVVVAVPLSRTSDQLDAVVTNGLVSLVVVVGLYTFIGLSGVFSFGHIAFMAIGAYACALLAIPIAVKRVLLPDLPGWLGGATLDPIVSAAAAGLIAAALALVVGIPILRLSGIAASIITFALLVVVQVVLTNWNAVTRGNTTMLGIPTFSNVWLALGVACLAILIVHAFQRSSVGLRLRASREDEVAARSSGIRVVQERLMAFVLSAFIVAVGGALYAGAVGAFNPGDFYISATVLTLAMLVVGGVESLAGAVVGTLVVTAGTEILSRAEAGIQLGSLSLSVPRGSTAIGTSLGMLLVLLYRPRGIMSGHELSWPITRARKLSRGINEQQTEQQTLATRD